MYYNSSKTKICRTTLINIASFWRPVTLLKRDSSRGVSSEFCKIFKNTHFTKHLELPFLKFEVNQKCHKIHIKIPVMDSVFIESCRQETANLTKKTLWHRYSLNFTKSYFKKHLQLTLDKSVLNTTHCKTFIMQNSLLGPFRAIPIETLILYLELWT